MVAPFVLRVTCSVWRTSRGAGDDDIDGKAYQLRGETRKSFNHAVGVAPLGGDVLAIHPTVLAQTL